MAAFESPFGLSESERISQFRTFTKGDVSRFPRGMGDYINQYLIGHSDQAPPLDPSIFNLLPQYSPDITGYTFVIMQAPDLSGFPAELNSRVSEICNETVFFALDFTPPAITINTEAINTQASVSMPYATTKVATGQISLSFLDNSVQDINSLHNVWIEYIYNQLWGDLIPADKYFKNEDSPSFGALDYATTLFVLKYDAAMDQPGGTPSMVGKATGIFPLGLPVKETIGTRSSHELVIQTINYTCSYFEVVHPKSRVQVYSTTSVNNDTIWDEAQLLIGQYAEKLAPGVFRTGVLK